MLPGFQLHLPVQHDGRLVQGKSVCRRRGATIYVPVTQGNEIRYRVIACLLSLADVNHRTQALGLAEIDNDQAAGGCLQTTAVRSESNGVTVSVGTAPSLSATR